MILKTKITVQENTFNDCVCNITQTSWLWALAPTAKLLFSSCSTVTDEEGHGIHEYNKMQKPVVVIIM